MVTVGESVGVLDGLILNKRICCRLIWCGLILGEWIRTEGVDLGGRRIIKKNGILARERNIEKILKASEDREYRKELLREYNLI